jgi:hypothetical protein
MTDKEELMALLTKWGVTYEVTETSIDVAGGYIGFFTSFEFDESGKFIKMGAWE